MAVPKNSAARSFKKGDIIAEKISGKTAGSWFFRLSLMGLLAFGIGDIVLRTTALNAVTSVRTMEDPVKALDVAPGARIRDTILPASSMDGRWWIIHTEKLLEQGGWRVRHSALDNAPEGREVHWSSLPLWILSGLAITESLFSGRSPIDSVQTSSFWMGPLTLLFTLFLLGWMAGKRFKPFSVAMLLMMVTLSPVIYQAFRPGEVDHHGLVVAFLLASVLALALGAAGLYDPSEKAPSKSAKELKKSLELKKWFAAGGVFGGIGMGISSASTIPVLVGCAGGCLLVAMLFPAKISRQAASHWRAWGFAGSLTCLGLYLMEYLPWEMGWRLEVNHPLYAMAWLGGSELLARAILFVQERQLPRPGLRDTAVIGAAILAVAIPLLVVMVFTDQTFWVSDPFLLQLHQHYISEFQSLTMSLVSRPMLAGLVEALLLPVFAILGTGAFFLIQRDRWHKSAGLLTFLIVPALVVQALAVWQIRWGVVSTGLWALYVMALIDGFIPWRGRRTLPLAVLTGSLVIVLLCGLPFVVFGALANISVLSRELPKQGTIPSILARDISHRLVQASPDSVPIVLSGPNTSTELAYFAGIKVLGTLYWENREGLKRAAEIFAERDNSQTLALLKTTGVNFILVSTWDNFMSAYDELHSGNSQGSEHEASPFLGEVLRTESFPTWLRPLHYPIPEGFGIEGSELRLFAVLPDQSPAEAAYFNGIYFAESERWEKALEHAMAAVQQDPQNEHFKALQSQAQANIQTTQRSNPKINP
jgi:hypothetical protein